MRRNRSRITFKSILEWLLSILCVVMGLWIYRIESIKLFINSNAIGLIGFLIAFVIVGFQTFINYSKTLGDYEEETPQSEFARKRNVGIWTVFWSLWSSYCAAITLLSFSWEILILGSVLAIVPGFIAFVSARQIRLKDINSVNEQKSLLSQRKFADDSYIMLLDKKYYSGYKGLICIPIFMGLILIGLLLGHLHYF